MSAQLNYVAASPPPAVDARSRLRCLWISRDIPFPLNAGDRIYSAQLAASLARANFEVHYFGFLPAAAEPAPADWGVQWRVVSGEKRGALSSMLSRLPRIAAMHATAAYQQVLREQLHQAWDVIVLDGYASGWALAICAEFTRAQLNDRRAATLVYVSHNHEAALWRAMWHATNKFSPKGLAVWQNQRKVQALEQAMLRQVSLITTITPQDAQAYGAARTDRDAPAANVVLTPGYAGARREARVINNHTPRHVVMLGSFTWLIKQQNLRQLIATADASFAAEGITLDIIGDVPEALRNELLSSAKATRFHGFVADAGPYLEQARIALVPEAVGGGFKLKFLDYVFARVPVFTIATALAGVPTELAQRMVSCTDLPALTQAVIKQIDDVEQLDGLQAQAYQAAASLFNWDDRGLALGNAIRSLRQPHE